MGIMSWLSGRSAVPVEQKSAPINLNVLDRLSGWAGGESLAGTVVSEVSALQVAAVLACVSRISLDVASMPMLIKRKNADGTDTVLDRARIMRLITQAPNPQHTAHQFVQMLTAQGALYGDGYAYIVRNSVDEPIELWPLQKTEVGVQRLGFDLVYTISAYEGAISGQFGARNVLHLRPQSMDGLCGLDRLVLARNHIGLAQAVHAVLSRSYKNGGRMPGYWSTDETLGPDESTIIATTLQASNTGDNQWKSPLLDRGMGYHSIGQTFDDSQLNETRRQEMIEVCIAFNMLPAVLGIDDKTQAFASVEAMFSAHLRHTLRPWLTCWEQCVDRDLLDGQGPLFAKFDTSDMEKATTKERAESYGVLMDNLVMMPSEARQREGLQPVAGIDDVWMQIVKGRAGIGPDTGEAE
jgi:HK97 family phage portal protein